MSNTTNAGTTPTPPKVQKDRSPSFPFIPLQTAVERLMAFEDYFRRHPAPAGKVGLAWGMKEASSQALQTVAALKAYGLVDYHGAGADRVAAVSDDGRALLRAQQDSIKREILKRAALKPKLIDNYWRLWGARRPPDPVCLDQLVLKGQFTESAAKTFLNVYDRTIAFAGLATSTEDFGSDPGEKSEHIREDKGERIEVGDLIQWEVNGEPRLPQPARVRALRELNGRSWVFVDGSETGVPIDEVTIEQKGVESPRLERELPAPSLPLETLPGQVQPIAGEQEWLRGPLSRSVSYRLFVSGAVGPKEVGKLIKLLEAQKAVLESDDEE